MKRFKLCSEGKCCPEVIISNGMVTIMDDHGGKVILTEEQLRILFDKTK